MSFQIPPDLQQKLGKFEQVKAQLQLVLNQKAEMDVRKRELEEASRAVENGKGAEVYRRIGDLMIKVEDKDALMKELTDEIETLGVRINSMENQEKSLKEMYESMGKEINEALKGYQ